MTGRNGSSAAAAGSAGTSVSLSLPDALLDVLAERVAALVIGQLGAAAPASAPWLDVTAAADYLCCKPRRLHDLVSQGRVPFYREGGRLMFRRSELDEWLTSGRAGDTRVTPPADRQCSSAAGAVERMTDPRVTDSEAAA